MTVESKRIALIASSAHPISAPFAGGLEAHVWTLGHRLRQRGHEVTLFAGEGSDPSLGVRTLPLRRLSLSAAARSDPSASTETIMAEHHAYLGLMLDLAAADGEYDVVHNHSLHHLPVAMARMVSAPMITTLHTPPTPWLESALLVGTPHGTYTAVSRHTASAWRHVVGARVVLNGIDLDHWHPGPGGGAAVWSGRITREKGLHLALDAAALAGVPLRVAGPVSDPDYFASEIAPRLARTDATHVGHLHPDELAALVGSASVALVTPCWDEPYGLVVAEALACGTPVAGFARGALPELIDDTCGVLVAPGDVEALAAALPCAAALDRGAARRRAAEVGSLDRMVDAYEDLYEELIAA